MAGLYDEINQIKREGNSYDNLKDLPDIQVNPIKTMKDMNWGTTSDRPQFYGHEERFEDFGDSKYDDAITQVEDLDFRSLEDVRSEGQSNWSSGVNSLVNMSVIAGTTFVDNIIGTAVGLGNGIFAATNASAEAVNDSDEDTNFWSSFGKGFATGFTDNPYSANVTMGIQDALTEAMPIYKSDKFKANEAKGDWNMGSFDFYAEGFKSFGYTVGSVASAVTFQGALSNIFKLAGKRAIVETAAKGLKAAANSGDDVAKQLITRGGKVLDDAAIQSEILAGRIVPKGGWGKEMTDAVKTMTRGNTTMNITSQLMGTMSEARIEGLHSGREFEEAELARLNSKEYQTKLALDIINEYGPNISEEQFNEELYNRNSKERENIQNGKETVQAYTLTGNIPVLLASSMLQFGKIIGRGFGGNKRFISSLGKDMSQDGSDRIVRDAAGKYVFNKSLVSTIGNVAGVTTKNMISEGIWEEMMQGSISKAAQIYAKDRLFTEYSNDIEGKKESIGVLSALGKGILEQYGNKINWQEAFFGGIFGGMGTISVGRRKSGKTGLVWAGGIGEAIKDEKYKNQTLSDLTDSLNTAEETAKRLISINGLTSQTITEKNKLAALNNDNEVLYNQEEQVSLINTLLTFQKAGKLQDFKDLVKNELDTYNTTDPVKLEQLGSELRALLSNTNPDGSVNQSSDTLSELSNKEIAETHLNEMKNLTKDIDNYARKAIEIKTLAGDKYNEQALDELVYLGVSSDKLLENIDKYRKELNDITSKVKKNSLIGNRKYKVKKDGDILEMTLPEILSEDSIARLEISMSESDQIAYQQELSNVIGAQQINKFSANILLSEMLSGIFATKYNEYMRSPSKLEGEIEKRKKEQIEKVVEAQAPLINETLNKIDNYQDAKKAYDDIVRNNPELSTPEGQKALKELIKDNPFIKKMLEQDSKAATALRTIAENTEDSEILDLAISILEERLNSEEDMYRPLSEQEKAKLSPEQITYVNNTLEKLNKAVESAKKTEEKIIPTASENETIENSMSLFGEDTNETADKNELSNNKPAENKPSENKPVLDSDRIPEISDSKEDLLNESLETEKLNEEIATVSGENILDSSTDFNDTKQEITNKHKYIKWYKNVYEQIDWAYKNLDLPTQYKKNPHLPVYFVVDSTYEVDPNKPATGIFLAVRDKEGNLRKIGALPLFGREGQKDMIAALRKDIEAKSEQYFANNEGTQYVYESQGEPVVTEIQHIKPGEVFFDNTEKVLSSIIGNNNEAGVSFGIMYKLQMKSNETNWEPFKDTTVNRSGRLYMGVKDAHGKLRPVMIRVKRYGEASDSTEVNKNNNSFYTKATDSIIGLSNAYNKAIQEFSGKTGFKDKLYEVNHITSSFMKGLSEYFYFGGDSSFHIDLITEEDRVDGSKDYRAYIRIKKTTKEGDVITRIELQDEQRKFFDKATLQEKFIQGFKEANVPFNINVALLNNNALQTSLIQSGLLSTNVVPHSFMETREDGSTAPIPPMFNMNVTIYPVVNGRMINTGEYTDYRHESSDSINPSLATEPSPIVGQEGQNAMGQDESPEGEIIDSLSLFGNDEKNTELTENSLEEAKKLLEEQRQQELSLAFGKNIELVKSKQLLVISRNPDLVKLSSDNEVGLERAQAVVDRYDEINQRYDKQIADLKIINPEVTISSQGELTINGSESINISEANVTTNAIEKEKNKSNEETVVTIETSDNAEVNSLLEEKDKDKKEMTEETQKRLKEKARKNVTDRLERLKNKKKLTNKSEKSLIDHAASQLDKDLSEDADNLRENCK